LFKVLKLLDIFGGVLYSIIDSAPKTRKISGLGY